MKRTIAFILTLAMALALCGCSGTSAEEPTHAPEPTPQITNAPDTASTDNPTADTDWESLYLEAAGFFYNDDWMPAYELIKDAEDCEYGPLLRLLGECYFSGYGVETDIDKGVELFKRSAALGDPLGMISLAYYYEAYTGDTHGEEEGELTEAFINSVDKIDESDPAYTSALIWQGWYYINGFSGKWDTDKAMELYMKAAELGDPNAMYAIGSMYYNGEGVEYDEEKAQEWFDMADQAKLSR